MAKTLLLVLAIVMVLWLLLRWYRPPRGVVFAMGDPAVAAAKAEARTRLPEFWAALAAGAPGDSDFMLKFDLCHGRGLSHQESIWARDIMLQDGAIHGRLANVPDDPAWHEGDAVVIDPDAIDDWCFFRNDIAQGHFITRLMIDRSAPHHAAKARKALGW